MLVNSINHPQHHHFYAYKCVVQTISQWLRIGVGHMNGHIRLFTICHGLRLPLIKNGIAQIYCTNLPEFNRFFACSGGQRLPVDPPHPAVARHQRRFFLKTAVMAANVAPRCCKAACKVTGRSENTPLGAPRELTGCETYIDLFIMYFCIDFVW